MLHIPHLCALHLDSILDDLVLLDELLDVDLSPVVLLLEALGIRGVVIWFSFVDVLSRLLLAYAGHFRQL